MMDYVLNLLFWAICLFSLLSITLDHLLTAIYLSTYKRRFKSGLKHSFYPPVSVLKPVKGVEADAEENFESHLLQDYPAPYELIFAVHSLNDAAVPMIEHLMRRHPNKDIKLVVSERNPKWLAKTNNLIYAERVAKYEYLLLSDSDVYAPPNLLRKLIAPFRDPKVGLLTAAPVYRRMENLGARFFGVMVNANSILMLAPFATFGQLATAIGSLLMIRRSVLKEIGGFEAIATHVADDHSLAQKTIQAGYTVHLSNQPAIITHRQDTIRRWWKHILRWHITMKRTVPFIYYTVFLRFGMLLSFINMFVRGFDIASVAIFSALALARWASFWVVNGLYFDNRAEIKHFWLLPLMDMVVPFIWFEGIFTNRIEWRGETYQVKRGGVIIPLTAGKEG